MILSSELWEAASRRRAKFCLLRAEFFEHAVDGQLDFIHQAGTLANVIRRPSGLYCFHCGFVVIHRGDEDDRRIGRNAMRMAQDFDAVDIRHLDIGDDQIVKSAVNFILGGLAGLHRLDAVSVAAQGNVEHFADGALIVANQNVSHAASLLPRQLRAARSEPWTTRERRSFQSTSARVSVPFRRRVGAASERNVVPCPGFDRAHTLPSCAWTIW